MADLVSVSMIRSLSRFLIVVGLLTLAFDLYFLWPSENERLLPKPQPIIRSIIQSNVVKREGGQQSGQEDKELVFAVLREAGMLLDADTMAKLPTWSQVVDQYGERPVILGLETCEVFRANVPEVDRMLGAAGMFSTGTNLVTHLLKRNCRIPARAAKYGEHATKEELGMRWQVPWGKHTDAAFKDNHATERAKEIRKEDILPIVTTRNPWRWMQSMCKNPYTARWPHHHQCPHLKVDRDGREEWNNITVTYGAGHISYTSLVHLWNDWYLAYEHASYPLLMIRMEDLVFHTRDTISTVCQCAGGELVEPFSYIQESAKKDSPGHDTSTGYAEAWIKYSQPLERQAGFSHQDYEAALEALDQNLLDKFHYHHPPT